MDERYKEITLEMPLGEFYKLELENIQVCMKSSSESSNKWRVTSSGSLFEVYENMLEGFEYRILRYIPRVNDWTVIKQEGVEGLIVSRVKDVKSKCLEDRDGRCFKFRDCSFKKVNKETLRGLLED